MTVKKVDFIKSSYLQVKVFGHCLTGTSFQDFSIAGFEHLRAQYGEGRRKIKFFFLLFNDFIKFRLSWVVLQDFVRFHGYFLYKRSFQNFIVVGILLVKVGNSPILDMFLIYKWPGRITPQIRPTFSDIYFNCGRRHTKIHFQKFSEDIKF